MSTWMVVEDEPDLYDTLLALFEIWSIDGVAFTNGTDAVKWIEDVDRGEANTNLPELALLDIRLPGVSGPEIGQRLRKSPVLNDVAIVMMTAYHLTPTEEKAVLEKSQAGTLLYKPLPSPTEFHAILQKAIETQNRPVQTRPEESLPEESLPEESLPEESPPEQKRPGKKRSEKKRPGKKRSDENHPES
jgi:CheY-like chemotaxis protein